MDAGATHTICYRPRGVSRCHFSLLSVGDFQSVLASQPQMKRGLLQYQMRKSRSRSRRVEDIDRDLRIQLSFSAAQLGSQLGVVQMSTL